MLAFIRAFFQATVILVGILLVVTYFMLLNQPRLGRNILYLPETGTETESTTRDYDDRHKHDHSHDTSSKVFRQKNPGQTQFSDDEQYQDENQNVLNLLTKRYWDLWKVAHESPATKVTTTDRFFTPDRLADVPTYFLLRPRSDYSHSSAFKNDDRILAQLVLGLEGLPDSYVARSKTIYLLEGYKWWNYGGDGDLSTDPVTCGMFKLNKCRLVHSRNSSVVRESDAVITSHNMALGRTPSELRTDLRLRPATKLLYFLLESPYIFPVRLETNNDWLNSYWRASDINTPYSKWAYYDPDVRSKSQDVNYAVSKVNKTSEDGRRRFAAIFMSNCNPHNARRAMVKVLQKYIPVDVYGQCGDLECPRKDETACFSMLQKNYKFYLSFENANCRDYITEKFFLNALSNNVIPVVLGAHPDDYRALAPAGSYIHVEDYGSIQELAEYLYYLDTHDEAYNSYFTWKGTGDFVDTKYFCRVCAMLHYADYIDSLARSPWPWPLSRLPGFGSRPANANGKAEVTNWDPNELCVADGHGFWNKTLSIDFVFS